MFRKLLYSLPPFFLAACGEVQDKYRDIKHLEMPPTLAIEHTNTKPVEPDVAINPKVETKTETQEQSSPNSDLQRLILIVGGDEKPVLELKTRFDRAWELVDNALKKAEIEIVEKNSEKGVFLVRYVDKDTSKGRNFHSSLFSFFTDKFEDIEYTLTVDKDKKITDVKVDKVVHEEQAASEHRETFNNDDTASLVKVLHDTIIANLEK